VLFSEPVNYHVEAGLFFVKRSEAARTATKDDGGFMDHGFVKVVEAEAWFLFTVKIEQSAM